jgi:hypothetical protein
MRLKRRLFRSKLDQRERESKNIDADQSGDRG